MAVCTPLARGGPIGGLEHETVHSFGGSSGGADVIIGVAAGVQRRAGIGYFNGQPLGRDFDGSSFADTWYGSYPNTGEAGFVYLQTITEPLHHEVFLLEPTLLGGWVKGWAVDLGDYSVDPEERLYIAGFYSGSGMEFGGTARGLSAPSAGEDGFVARITGTAPGWAGHLRGSGNARVLALQSSGDLVDTDPFEFLKRLPLAGEDGERSAGDPTLLLACAGSFSGQVEYQYDDHADPVAIGSAVGGEDAFILLLHTETGELLSSVAFGGTGDEVIRSLTLSFAPDDDADVPVIFVTGSFSGTVNFNPNGAAEIRTATGVSDIFAARYRPNDADLVLDWVWTTGTAGKQAAGEGIDVVRHDWRGDVFDVVLAGWSGYEQGQTNPDIWFARVHDDPGDNPSLSLVWEHTLENNSICRAYDVAVDSFNRVVIAGYFAGTLDFDADPSATDLRTSDSNSYDAFITRYSLSGAYSGTDVFGGNVTEVTFSIDANRETGQYVYGGWFGGGSSTGYTVDFDPDPTKTANVIGAGGSDGFISILNSAPPEVETAIMLILDASASMVGNDYKCSPTYRYWNAMIDAYADIIGTDATVVPRDGTVALAATIFAYESAARQVVPWMMIDSDIAAYEFVGALRSISPTGGPSYAAPAIEVARESFEAGMVIADHNIINIIGNGFTDTENALTAARDAALNPISGVVELINGVAIMAGSPSNAPPPDESLRDHIIGFNPALGATGRYGCLAIADGEYSICPPADGISEFHLYQIVKFIFEISGCQGDFSQNCLLDQGDLAALLSMWGMDALHPDWDPSYDLDRSGEIDQGDLAIFLASWGYCSS